MSLKDIYTKHKKKILVTISAGLLYLIATFGLGIKVDVSDISAGNVSGIGKAIETAPESP